MSLGLRERIQGAFEGELRIEGELGRGSIARVYAARDLAENRRMALKVLSPELSCTVDAERFQREIRIGSRLSHPRIAPIYRSGCAGGLFYFTMPFLDGESLAQRLDREGPLPLDEALRVTRQVAEALEHAHSHGVLHRDVKPRNIMLTRGGAVVMDFGIAAIPGSVGHERLTEAGLTMGTPHYMSPEQATGDPCIDGRSDLYGLACVLYEMLAGHPPFRGSSALTVLTRQARDPVPPLSSARPDVPGRVESALVKALSKQPAERFASPGEFARALSTAPRNPGDWLRELGASLKRRLAAL